MRTRIMPVAFLGALALLATRTCASELAHVELRLVFGQAGGDVRAVQVEVFRGADRETLAELKRSFDRDGAVKPVVWKLQLDPGMYILEFRIRYKGRLRQLKKPVKAINDATITIDLERDLLGRSRRAE